MKTLMHRCSYKNRGNCQRSDHEPDKWASVAVKSVLNIKCLSNR